MAPSTNSLNTLAQKAAKLNEKTDELNAVFEALEAKLAAAKVGVSAWLPRLLEMEVGEPSEQSGLGSDDGYVIGYAKIGGDWRLAARAERWPFAMDGFDKQYDDDSYAIGPTVPLVTAPRAVRVEAAGLLDDLIEALTNKVDKYLSNIEKAKEAASVTPAARPALKVGDTISVVAKVVPAPPEQMPRVRGK